MAAIFNTTVSNAISWMKMYEFRLKFHQSLLRSVQLTYPSIGLDNGLALKRRQAIIWTNAGPVHRSIYAALVGDELSTLPFFKYRGSMIRHRVHCYVNVSMASSMYYSLTYRQIQLNRISPYGKIEWKHVNHNKDDLKMAFECIGSNHHMELMNISLSYCSFRTS